MASTRGPTACSVEHHDWNLLVCFVKSVPDQKRCVTDAVWPSHSELTETFNLILFQSQARQLPTRQGYNGAMY